MQRHIMKMAELASRYKDLWKTVDMLRARRGDGTVPDWPAWCFMPAELWADFCRAFRHMGGMNKYPPEDWLSLACLGAWRPGQDIFRFDPELFEALVSTPLTKVPTDVLYRMPTWCVYIETPGVDWLGDADMEGYFAWLDSSGPDLMLVPDHESTKYTPFAVRLTEENLQGGLCEAIKARMPGAYPESGGSQYVAYIELTSKMLSLLLYLCSTQPDVVDHTDVPSMPGIPHPIHVKKTGWRLFPPDQPHVWRVGETIGRQIRTVREGQAGLHTGPRPHIRRAHWHGFWSGTIKPRAGVEPTPRKFDLKWLPPTPVAMGDDDDG